MQPIIKDIREISDSKEMYEAKPNPFLSIFIYIVLVAIIACGVWLYFGEIDIVSKGRGVIRPNENVSIIRSKVQSEITEWHLEEGKQVEKGELLFSTAYEDLKIKKLQIVEVLKETNKTLGLLKKLKDSIAQDKNLFSITNEKEYYDRYLKYHQDYEALKNEVEIDTKQEVITTNQTEINRQIYQDKISEYDKVIKALGEFRASVQAEESQFTDKECKEALEFNTYLFKVYELKKVIEDKKVVHNLNESLDEEALIGKKELEDSQVELNLAENELSKLEVQTLKEIENQLKDIQIAKQLAEQEMRKLIIDEGLLGVNQNQRTLSIQKYKTDVLVPIYNQINEMELVYKTKKRELEGIELAIKDCTITAPIAGTINMTSQMRKGDLMPSGLEVATIIPSQDSLYKIEIFMPNREIAGIKLGDTVKYKFDALPYKEYGQLAGQITNIAADAKINNAQGVSGYALQGSIENKTIYSYKGEPAELKVGMTCEAHVVTEQKKILFYLLEKINLKE